MSAESPAWDASIEAWNARLNEGQTMATEVHAALREIERVPLPKPPLDAWEADLDGIAAQLLAKAGFTFDKTRLVDGAVLFQKGTPPRLWRRPYHSPSHERVQFLTRGGLPTPVLAVLPAPFTMLLVALSAAVTKSFGPGSTDLATIACAGAVGHGALMGLGVARVTSITATATFDRDYTGTIGVNYALMITGSFGTERLTLSNAWIVADPVLRPALDEAVAACRAHHTAFAAALDQKIAAWDGLFETYGYEAHRVALHV